MTEESPQSMTADGAAVRAPPPAGAMLRAAREAAGLSLDAVAQQLKLAPRQVLALEEGDYAALPGRTFVRGFLRNYARLVRVDAAAVLAALDGRDAPALDLPALQPTAPTIGELPTNERARPGWARWAIPLTLVAAIATATIYEVSRSYVDGRHSGAPAPAAADTERPAARREATPPGNESPLPNPMASSPAASGAGTAEPAPAPAAPSAPVLGTMPVAEPPTGTDAPLVLTFRDSSWTEVKDGTGRLLVSQMMAAGQTRAVAGTPPFEVVLGNASAASVTYHGKPVDLAPYTRQRVARVVLP